MGKLRTHWDNGLCMALHGFKLNKLVLEFQGCSNTIHIPLVINEHVINLGLVWKQGSIVDQLYYSYMYRKRIKVEFQRYTLKFYM